MQGITGTEGLSPGDIARQVRDGARFVRFQYSLSLILWTVRRESRVYFLKAGEHAIFQSLPYSLVSFICGWWSFPFGIITTLRILARNFGGGYNVTTSVMASMRGRDFR